jgi:ribosome-binding ATPase
VHAIVEFVDIGGLVEGASKGEGLGNRFLGGIREVDAVVLVLRAFQDADVMGPTDPLEHLATVETELALADLQSVEGRVERVRKGSKLDKSLVPEVDALDAALAVLSEGTPIYRADLTAEQRSVLRPWFLLTNKPVLVVVNVDEDQLADVDAVTAPVRAAFGDGAEVLGLCVQLEAETAQLDPDERAEMMEAYGLSEGALPRLIRAAHQLLGRRTFLTTGEKESRAWTIRAGAKAPEAAGAIHTDFQRGFIKAEVIRWDELLELGSWSKARDVGKLRIEGKDYEVRDGDVLEFRFNV